MSAEPASASAPTPPSRSLLHRIDDAVYAAERVAVVATTIAMVLMVFFDVVDRRLEARESKLAALLFALGKPFGAARAGWVETKLAPALGLAILALLIWFALATVRRRGGRS